jgi:uncharacterized membrane protein YjjB (DUF3815 family)
MDVNIGDFFIAWVGAILGIAGSAVTFRIPVRALFGCVIAGILGWQVSYMLGQWGIVPVYCSFMGAVTISLCSEILARAIRMPATVFVVPGILPLVPGTLTYDSMYFLIQGNSDQALAAGMKAMLIASGIAGGMLMGTAIAKGFINPSLQNLHASLKDDFAISIPELIGESENGSEKFGPGQTYPKPLSARRIQRIQKRRNKYKQAAERAGSKKSTPASQENRRSPLI